MFLLIISFLAGVLTVLAPCILPLLPVIIGGSVSGSRKSRPLIVVASLSVSVIVFTLLLKFSTALIDIPQSFWQWVSGIIIISFGLTMLFPDFWEKIALKFNLTVGRKSNELLAQGVKKESVTGDIIIGSALGPVFTSCSPTYFVILATVLPESFAKGFVYLLAYTIGLSLMLLLISLLGQKLTNRLQNVSDPKSVFKRSLGVLFILVGVFIISGFDKKIQTWVIKNGVFDITKVEQKLLEKLPNQNGGLEVVNDINGVEVSGSQNTEVKDMTEADINSIITSKSKRYPKFVEIENPAGFVNSEPFKLVDYVGKKVILLDVMTYSCINCQRTFPYLRTWYETYEKDGLLIVGIHTPEFAFEKKKENVERAMKEFGLTFPIVLDNDYSTWNALDNNVWPRKYLIDIDGFIVYDHKGEGAYMEIEEKIKELLKERAMRLGEKVSVTGNIASTISENKNFARSPETYFGALRNNNFASGQPGKVGEQDFTEPQNISTNYLYLSGKWNIQPEYAKSISNSEVYFKYGASKIFIVASAQNGGEIKVYKDGVLVRTVDVKDSKLYTLIDGEPSNSVLRLEVSGDVELYAFTFG